MNIKEYTESLKNRFYAKKTIPTAHSKKLLSEVLALLESEYEKARVEGFDQLEEIIHAIKRFNFWDEPTQWKNMNDWTAEDLLHSLVSQAQEVVANEKVAEIQFKQQLGVSPEKTAEEPTEIYEPAENELEDAINWVDATKFDGSEKQIKWAKDIAHKNLEYICRLWKESKEPSTSAKWWIDNRNDI